MRVLLSIALLTAAVSAGRVAALSASGQPAATEAAGSTFELAADGAWSWFSGPRAFCQGDTVVAAWVTSDGRLQAGRCDLRTGLVSLCDVVPDFERDDHSHPVLVRTSDGRYTAFYSIHAGASTFLMYRVATGPSEMHSWLDERKIGANTPGFGGVTYPNLIPFHGASDTLLAFWRGGNWNPTCATLTYDAQASVWRTDKAVSLISYPGERPYAKYAADSRGRVGVVFTDGHPREVRNSLYYLSVEWPRGDGGAVLLAADGERLGSLAVGPLIAGEAELVFDRASPPSGVQGNCWVWDVAFDDSDRPVVAYSTFVSRGEHQYRLARYDGEAWETQLLVPDAGGSIADTTRGYHEYYYSGGMALDPVDPGIVYLSLPNDSGGWDIEQWKTRDRGRSWMRRPVTSGSADKNVRPVVPLNRPASTEIVLWMSGRYEYYTDYNTAIRLWRSS